MEIIIRKVALNDAKILFDWANDPITRQNSFNSNTISWIDHLNWLKNKISSDSSKIFIISNSNKPIGVVRFEEDESNTIIGITIAPEHRGQNFGSKLIQIACRKYWKESSNSIHAYIKEENIRSQKAFEKSGFVFLKNGMYNNNPCIILIAEKK